MKANKLRATSIIPVRQGSSADFLVSYESDRTVSRWLENTLTRIQINYPQSVNRRQLLDAVPELMADIEDTIISHIKQLSQ